jgi:FkbM family methyltransferase
VYAFEPLTETFITFADIFLLNDLQIATSLKGGLQRRGDCGGSPQPLGASSKTFPRGATFPSTTLDNCIFGELRFRPPDVIKIDVEGAELEVLQGASRAISEFHPTVFVELHGTELHADCHNFLVAKGYKVEDAYAQLVATHISTT